MKWVKSSHSDNYFTALSIINDEHFYENSQQLKTIDYFCKKVLDTPLATDNSSTIKLKDKSQNRCYRKINHAEFSEKRTFNTP